MARWAPRRVVAALLVASLLPGAQAQFPDVPPGHPAESAVAGLADLGVLSGFPDGLYRGQRPVNRFELALVLTRMWSAWSTEQLSDVFSQLTTAEINLARLRQRQAALTNDLEALRGLEGRLGRSETALAELDARTQGVAATAGALGGLNAELRRLEGRVGTALAELRERARGLESRVGPDALGGRLGTVESRLQAQGARLARFSEVQERRYDDLTGAFAGDPAKGWRGTLLAAGGVNGSAADYRLGVTLDTPSVRLAGELTPAGPEVLAETRLTPGVVLTGRHHVGLDAVQGAVGVRFAVAGGLTAGVYGGFDSGLAAGALLTLRGDEPGAALPGVTASAGATADLSAGGGLGSELLVQASLGVALDGGTYRVVPQAFYRRQTGVGAHQTLGGELSLVLSQEAFSLAAAGRVGLSTDPSTEESLVAPEADVRLSLPSGAFFQAALSGGLPDINLPPSFADGSPLLAEQLVLGARVGVAVPLEDLVR